MDSYVGDEQYAIYDDARDYFVAGQYVVFYAYDDDYSQHYLLEIVKECIHQLENDNLVILFILWLW